MTITKRNLKTIILAMIGGIIVLVALTQIGYATTDNKSYPERVKENKLYYNEHPSFADEQKLHPEVAKLQLDSWHRVVNRLDQIVPVKEWRLISSGDIDLEFTNYLPDQEVSTFNQAYFSEERKSELEAGDIFPGALISPSKDKVILLWEKSDGSGVYFQLDSKLDDNGLRTWFLNGKANIIAR